LAGHTPQPEQELQAQDLLKEVGRALRRARRSRGLTLRDVGSRSGGRFKATAVAAYERGDRSISLERFCRLSQLYGMAPDRLLLQVLWRVAGRPEPMIDLTQVSELPADERENLGSFVRAVQAMRDGGTEPTITLRVQDLEVLATESGTRLDEFLERLQPALARVDERG
jgi:transcriptional regulator with XRE-family HTH domain